MTDDAPTRRRFPDCAFDPPVVAEVAGALAREWDARGRILRAAVADAADDPLRPHSYAAIAHVVCGIVAAGGSQADVLSYLRGEEESLFGEARSTGQQRGAVALAAWTATGRDRRDAEMR